MWVPLGIEPRLAGCKSTTLKSTAAPVEYEMNKSNSIVQSTVLITIIIIMIVVVTTKMLRKMYLWFQDSYSVFQLLGIRYSIAVCETVCHLHVRVLFSVHFNGHFPGEPGLAGVY